MRRVSNALFVAAVLVSTAVIGGAKQAPLNMPVTVPTSILISDVLPRAQQIGIFSGLTRDVDAVSTRLETDGANATVLAPDNETMRGLPRKPWENPSDAQDFGAEAYVGEEGNKRAQDNLKRFVEAHIIPESPLVEGKKVRTLAGNQVWLESHGDEKRVSRILLESSHKSLSLYQIQPGNIQVVQVAESVSNGEVWVLKGVINYAV